MNTIYVNHNNVTESKTHLLSYSFKLAATLSVFFKVGATTPCGGPIESWRENNIKENKNKKVIIIKLCFTIIILKHNFLYYIEMVCMRAYEMFDLFCSVPRIC